MPGPVERWLETFMCQQYADTFEAYGFKTLQSVCQLQQPQLHAMGVAQEHIEKILESVHVLRQSMFGGMNHYKDEGFSGQANNRVQHTGYPPQAHSMGGMNSNYMSQVGYNNQGNNMAAHRGQFMDGMYQQHSSPQYPPPYSNQSHGPYNMGQYNQQNSSYGPMMGYSNNQHRMQNHPAAAPTHVHPRNQNPQEVANNILQMAASYQPSQTVQVPLSKHRSAPYHVPVSSHYNMHNHVGNPEHVNRQFNFPNSSQHNHHATRTSPVSPGSMYMHSPASQHSSQSLPNSSPRSIHSPPGYGGIKSPVPTPSPAGSLRSPCHMQSPVNTPINQQLHITTGQQMVQSPTQQQMGYSPKNNPISPTVIHSPQYKHPPVSQQHHVNQKTYITENVGNAGNNYTANSPLQSLQKLCMLPDRQVVDPKSIVNDSSVSPTNQNQKNVNSDVDSNSLSNPAISETASANICTDGKNCDQNTENNSNELIDTSDTDQSSQPKSNLNSEKKQETTVESYADDAVKKSAEDSVKKVDIDLEQQKLKYLGQPCKTETCIEKLSDSNIESGKSCPEDGKNSDFNDQNKQCDNNIHEVNTLNSESHDLVDQSPDLAAPSGDRLQNTSKSEESVSVEQIQESVKTGSKDLDSTESKSHDGEQKSHDSEQKSHDITEHVIMSPKVKSEFDLKSDIEIDSRSICDKSVDGCENINCDDQSKTYISSDCRKDEVKSVVNGIDDSDDVCSDIDTNKKDLLLRENQINSQSGNKNNAIINSTKNSQKHKNQEKNENKRVLREIPARLASASPYYVESDSDDDGILLVRKDVKYTYSRFNKVNHNINAHVFVSSNDIIHDISDESLDRNSLDSDISKGFDSDLTSLVKPVTGKEISDDTKSKSLNGPSSDHGQKKKKGIAKGKKKQLNKQKSASDNPGHGSNVKIENARINSRAKRTRTTTSKYGDEMYLGDDFVLDSEEEIEIEKKSKRKRKVSGDPKSKIKSEICVIESDNDSEIEFKRSRKRTPSSEDKSDTKHKIETDDSAVDVLDTKEICIDIIDSSDNLGDGSDIITFKNEQKFPPFQPVPSTSKSQCENKPIVKKVKPQTKSKTKLTKVSKSKSRGKLLNDSIKDMKLKKTMNLMKQKGKKKEVVAVKEIRPFLRIKDSGTQKEKCLVVNQQIEETCDKNSKNKKSPVSISTVNMSKVPSEKSVYWPASLMGDNSVWVCALCQKHSSYKFLGDLFGPYYIEGNLPEDTDGTNSMDKKGKQKRQSLTNSAESKSIKGKRKSREPLKPQEVWVHEDCAAWADGVLLIGAKIYGLQEATNIASTTVCTFCKETGAMVGCLHKGCSQKFHYYCGIESGCYLDEENYSLLCPKHREKRLKSAEAKSYKT